MATITNDLVDGQITSGPDGLTLTRVALVEGLTSNADERMLEAITVTGIPRRGDFHPSIAGLAVASVSAVPVGAGQARVTITYGVYNVTLNPPDESAPPQVTVGSTVQGVETNLDVDGNAMKLDFFVADPDENGNVFYRQVEYTGTVSKQDPQTVARFSRREPFAPLTKSKTYVGKMNSNAFLGDPPRYWLCTRIEGTSNDGGLTYQVEYEFQRNASTWDVTIVGIDDQTDQPPDPADVVPGQGETSWKETFQIYEEVDFSGLNLV